MDLCPHCGKNNQEDSRFCAFCGSRIGEQLSLIAHLLLLGEEEQREFLITQAERHIGRNLGNDIVITDEEMSSRHACFSRADGKFWVEDLGSTNGTFVNGQRIQAPTSLRDEDLLKMGRTFLKFKV